VNSAKFNFGFTEFYEVRREFILDSSPLARVGMATPGLGGSWQDSTKEVFAMAVMLEPGHGKDGNPSFPYVREHPTNYDWRQDIELLTHRLVNRDSFRGYIWINTYERHPPGGEDDFWRHRDTTSFDVWGFDGRGDPRPVGWFLCQPWARASQQELSRNGGDALGGSTDRGGADYPSLGSIQERAPGLVLPTEHEQATPENHLIHLST
jgi:hypothetical protein